MFFLPNIVITSLETEETCRCAVRRLVCQRFMVSRFLLFL